LATYATEVDMKVGQAPSGTAVEAGEAVAILWNNMRDGSRDAASEFTRMGDVLTLTQQRFQLKNLSQLTEGLKYATPAAKTAKLAVEDMSAAIGRLNSAGLQGSMAGTALANLLANRFKAAKEIGFKVAVKKGTGELDLLRTLENLKAAIGDINRLSPEMEDKLRKGFGEEGFRAVMLLLTQTEALKEDLQAVRDSAGSFERASRIINDAAGAKWQQMANRIEQVWIRLGEALMPLKDWIADYVMRAVDAIDSLIQRFPKLTQWAVGGLAALSGVAAAAGTALVAIGALGKLRALKGLLGGDKGQSGSGGLVDAATAALGGVQKVWVVNMPGGGLPGMGVPDLGGKTDKAGQAARGLGARLRSLVAGVAMQVSMAWQTIAAWGAKVAAVAATAWSAISAGALAAGRAVMAAGQWMLANPIVLILAAIAAAAYLVWRHWDVIGPQLAAVWQTVKAAFADAWAWISAVPQRMLAVGQQIIDGLLAGLRQRWETLKASVSGIASGIADTVRGALGIRSPSRVFADIGGHLMGGLQQGIERAAALPLAAMRSVAGALAVPITAGAVSMASPAVPPVQAADPIRLPPPPVQAADPIRLPPPPVQAADPIRLPPPPVQAADPIRLPPPPVQAAEPIRLPQPAVQAAEPIRLPQQESLQPATARPSPDTARPPTAAAPMRQRSTPDPYIQITVNLNGPATPEAAQDVASAVRREVERALADAARRESIARRAAMIDGGLA
ncbi:MAG: phage tail tape measure protein, partial [Rhodocyclaceae bacterium]|nr:phage tail tape measure protein [Rhodocyclaceae bacterium]